SAARPALRRPTIRGLLTPATVMFIRIMARMTLSRLACLPLLTLLLAACTTRPASTSSIPPPSESGTPASVLLVSLDGFRADYLDLGITPNLARIAREGVRAEWMNPSYPTLTFPNHYTLVTGLRPDHHGIVHNTMPDAAIDGDFRPASRRAV